MIINHQSYVDKGRITTRFDVVQEILRNNLPKGQTPSDGLVERARV